MNIEIIDQEANDVVGQLTAGLRQFNVEHLGDEATQPLTIVARNTTGDIIGGVAGRTIYKNLLINLVWIDAHYRGQGLGQKLMQVAQTQAIKRAIDKVEEQILNQHLSGCVTTAIRSNDESERERVIGELMAVFKTSNKI